jgi:MFS family permease
MGFTRAPEDRPTPSAVYNYRPYLLTFLSCLGSWMFGYNNGVIAGVLVLPSFYNDFHLPPVGSPSYNDKTSNIVSLFQIGGLVGSMLTFPIMKYWGRKIGMMIWGTVYFLGAALQTFCYGSLDMMYIGRLIAGFGTGGVTVVVPLVSSTFSIFSILPTSNPT